MTVRVERTFEVSASPEHVWSFIADPENRARAISVVADYERHEGTDEMIWNVELPIPLVDRTVPVYTEDVTREPPTHVEFRGRSKIMHVRGEHHIEPTETGSTLTNVFVVDGRLPGVERFFKRNLDEELANLDAALRRHLTRTRDSR